MSRSNLRIAIIVLTIITALIHLALGVSYLGDATLRTLGILFILNCIGYLVLLASLFTKSVPFLSERSDLSHYLLIGFATVTIIAFFVINKLDIGVMSGITKLDEVLLVIATYMHLRAK